MNGLELSDKPFVGGMSPLFGGDLVETLDRVAPDGRAFSVEIRFLESVGHQIRAVNGALSYVVGGPEDEFPLDFAQLAARSLPIPDDTNTHTILKVVMPRQDGAGVMDFVVQVQSGDLLSEGRRTGPFSDDGRPWRDGYYMLFGYGSEPAIPTFAGALSFTGLVYDDRWDVGGDVAAASFGMRSVWLQDASDYASTNRSLFKLLRRESNLDGMVPKEFRPDRNAAFEEHRECPVSGPNGPIERLNVSPGAIANFMYVSEPDPVVRSFIRQRAIDDAVNSLDAYRVRFLERATTDMTFAEFLKSCREYRLTIHDVPARYLTSIKDCEEARVFGETRRGDGLVLWHEIYFKPQGNSVASRFHVPTAGGTVCVRSSDVAAALLYMEAQCAKDPRVSQEPLSAFDYEALSRNGSYHGWDWSSFQFPDAPDFHLRIRTVENGFRSEFREDVVHPTLESALRSSYDDLTEFQQCPVLTP